jgi:hypothetical protein
MKTVQPLNSAVGWSGLQRPLFSAGLLLEDEDLTAGINYSRDMLRLLFSSLFGCGVICGLGPEPKVTCENRKLTVTVSPGLALDGGGNPIHVKAPVTIQYAPDCKELPAELWVTLCHREKACRKRDAGCANDDDGEKVPTRQVEGFEIELLDYPPACACHCANNLPPKPTAPKPGGCCEDTPAEQGKDQTDDTNEKAGTAKEQLERKQKAVPSVGSVESPTNCHCYDDHNSGKCSCGCGCGCVVLGRFKRKQRYEEEAGKSTYIVEYEKDTSVQVVRKIRPVLIGQLDCPPFPPKAVGVATPEAPHAGQPQGNDAEQSSAS